MDALTERLGAELGGTWTWDVLYPPYRNVLLKDGEQITSAETLRVLYAKATRILENLSAA